VEFSVLMLTLWGIGAAVVAFVVFIRRDVLA